MALHCPSLATLCQLYGPQYHCIETTRSNVPWLAPVPAAKAPRWCEAADTLRPGAENLQREGAGPEVPLALASMAMGRLPTSYHCRRIPHILHRGCGDKGLHPDPPGPRRHLLLSRATGHQPTTSLTTDLSTRVTVALVLDCHLLRPLSTSCP